MTTALRTRLAVLLTCGCLLPAACEDPGDEGGGSGSDTGETGDGDGDGDGDATETESGDGDTGDGDSGDGDTGDGDTGDGDSGDGDGDPGEGELCEIAPKLGSASCGDGLVGLGESCDDGNQDDTDACSNACTSAHAVVDNFAVADMSTIAVMAAQQPEQSQITLLSNVDRSLHAFDVDGSLLWTSAQLAVGSSWPLAHRTLPDGSSVVVGIDFADDRTWSAHLDAQGNITSQGSHDVDLGAPARNLLVRDDGTAVFHGGTFYEDSSFQNVGVVAVDAGDVQQWMHDPFFFEMDGMNWSHLAPGGVGQLGDGTVVAMHRVRTTQNDAYELTGVGFSGLDPTTGEQLWTSNTGCSEPLPSDSAVFATLADDTLTVAMLRNSDTEIMFFDSVGTLTGREQFPEIDTFDRPVVVVPDTHAGAIVVGMISGGSDNAYAAYVHADQTRRFVVTFDVPGDVLDAALEADDRLWVLGMQGVVAVGLDP